MITTSSTLILSNNSLVNFICVIAVVAIVNILKYLIGDGLSERQKDVIYPILSAIFSALGMYLGFIDVSGVSDVLTYLFGPAGVFITFKKILGK
jgi:hypothetical protein